MTQAEFLQFSDQFIHCKSVDSTIRNTIILSFYDIREAANAYAFFKNQKYLVNYVHIQSKDSVKIPTQQFNSDAEIHALLETYDIKSISLASEHAIISYYDIRDTVKIQEKLDFLENERQ